jgi:protein-S-isoprenylcysteine O-methyltransferase Ste14
MAISSTSEKPDSAGVNLMPPTIFYGCLIAGIALELILRPPISLLPQPTGLYAGSALAVAGLLFSLWANARFHSVGVTVKCNKPAAHLVATGAYRFSRNPMYVGFVAILAGIGLAAGSLPMLLSALPMFLYLDCYVIAREEKYLTRRFGGEYEAYRARVRRWL